MWRLIIFDLCKSFISECKRNISSFIHLCFEEKYKQEEISLRFYPPVVTTTTIRGYFLPVLSIWVYFFSVQQVKCSFIPCFSHPMLYDQSHSLKVLSQSASFPIDQMNYYLCNHSLIIRHLGTPPPMSFCCYYLKCCHGHLLHSVICIL